MNFLKWLNNTSDTLEKTFLAGTIIFTSLLLFVNVVMRYVFMMPIYWAEELVRYLMVWLVFIGASQVTSWGGHIAVDILPRFLSKRGNLILAFAVNMVCIAFCGVLAYYSLEQMLRVKAAHQVSPAMELPMWLAYAAIPAGTVLMLIRYIQQFFLRIQGKTVVVIEVLD
jgi:C4-dicarboxylate transporter, DctQ subunit